MLTDRAIQPWDVLEVDLMNFGVESLASYEYLLPAADKPSQNPPPFGYDPNKHAVCCTPDFALILDVRIAEGYPGR